MAGIVELQSVFDIHFNCKKIWQFYSSMNPQPSDLWKSLVFQLCSITSANWYKQMYAMAVYTWVQSNKRQNPTLFRWMRAAWQNRVQLFFLNDKRKYLPFGIFFQNDMPQLRWQYMDFSDELPVICDYVQMITRSHSCEHGLSVHNRHRTIQIPYVKPLFKSQVFTHDLPLIQCD